MMKKSPAGEEALVQGAGLFEDGSDRFWKTVIDTMMDGLMVVDLEGTILIVNQAMEQITGYSRDELVGQPCTTIKCDTCFGAMLAGQGHHCKLFQEEKVRRCHCVMQRRDGSPLQVLKNATVLKSREGKVVAGVETITDLSQVVAKEKVISRLRRELSKEDGFYGILGKSPVMTQLFTLIASAAQSQAPVVIYGESGTGKELVAAALHRLGPRRKGPFIKVNSAALSESLLESELFGHVKGAFTGADRTRVGRFEAAQGGDLFLDEVGDLPLSTQAKLLRVLQEKVIEKVGDHKPIAVDARIITATNQDLNRLMAEGRFREDLFYRISVIPIHLPPLRERREDIPLLAEAFIERTRLKTEKPIKSISKEALELLLAHGWPGNVRELINIIEYAFVLCPEGTIRPDHLPTQLLLPRPRLSKIQKAEGTLQVVGERELLVEAMTRTRGKKSEAARLLGISRVTLWKRLKAHNIQVDRIIQG